MARGHLGPSPCAAGAETAADVALGLGIVGQRSRMGAERVRDKLVDLVVRLDLPWLNSVGPPSEPHGRGGQWPNEVVSMLGEVSSGHVAHPGHRASNRDSR